jgi:hypothetical protein
MPDLTYEVLTIFLVQFLLRLPPSLSNRELLVPDFQASGRDEHQVSLHRDIKVRSTYISLLGLWFLFFLHLRFRQGSERHKRARLAR